MLADVGNNDGVAAGDAPKIVHYVGGVQVAGVGQILDVADRGCALGRFNGLEPGGAVASGHTRQKLFQHGAQIADESDVDLNVFVDFGGVDFDVNFFGFQGIGGGGSGDPIVEAHAAGDQQIGLLNCMVDPGFAMHAHHAHVEGM